MKLKRLEIIGFKSFMERTVVTFEKDITAIVGPNGCGKSNIVDAIRWVMGEQSAKHLRGKEMADVIFAGSESRAPLSLASVELTFSNEGYQTPAAYLNHSEISICRRLYRTGESEYFINKIPVRLKDITDLFLGTGIGTKAYSVIEQDKISRIVMAKPEERRFFIEEVAGISKFKARKEAALRKMEATQQNLLRLTDLTTELERQIKSLERQVKKAEKYRDVKKEFVKWDLALSSVQYQEASISQDQWEKELRAFDEEECSLKSKLATAENQLETARDGFAEQEREIGDLQNNLFEATNYVRLLEAQLKHRADERNELAVRFEELAKTRDELNAEVLGIRSGLSQINEQKLLADFEEEELKDNMENGKANLDEAERRLNNLISVSKTAMEKVYQAEGLLAQMAGQKEGKSQKEADLTDRIVREEEEFTRLGKQIKDAAAIHREAGTSLASLKQLNLDLSMKTDEITSELAKHRSNLEREEALTAKLKEELTHRKSRLESLVELQKNFEGYQEGTRSVLLKQRDSGEAGIFGTVADFVETEPRFEGAVSAVLGEKLHYVVVKSQQDGVAAIDYLRTASGGRTSFVPVSLRAHAEETGEIPVQEGILGPLKNFVTLKEDCASMSEFLFGDVVLVNDLSKALDVWSANGHRKTLVTLGGEVVDPAGVITGGSLTGTSKALLEKKREMQELSLVISKLQMDLATKEGERRVLSERVNGLEKALEAVKTTSVEEIIRIASQEKDISQIKKELETLGERRNQIGARLTEEKTELETILREIRNLEATAEKIREDLEKDRESLTGSQSSLESAQAEFSGLNEKVTAVKIDYAKAFERNRHLEAELDRLKDEAFRLRMELAETEAAEEIMKNRREFIQGYVAHAEKVMGKKLGRKATLEEELKAGRASYEAAQGAIRAQEVAIREMRQAAEGATARLNKVTVSLTEVRGRMKYLTEQILERHQINLSDSYATYLDPNLDRAEAEEKSAQLKAELVRLGEVNTGALEEFEELKTRFDFLSHQKNDLDASLKSLERVIHKINRTTREKFLNTFQLVNERFQKLFPQLFQGGQARLMLTDEENLLETGVEIIAQPPGKKLQSITLLSGGEKALTAVSLIFSIFQIKPSPFCILDEVDAPLDDVNVGRYNEILREMTGKTQFIVITHNKRTMEVADMLYGVTMQEAGISQLVSVNLS